MTTVIEPDQVLTGLQEAFPGLAGDEAIEIASTLAVAAGFLPEPLSLATASTVSAKREALREWVKHALSPQHAGRLAATMRSDLSYMRLIVPSQGRHSGVPTLLCEF